MRVFVTGVNGYIGAVLAPYLMERGLEVVGLDTGYYRDGWLYSDDRRFAVSPYTLNKDLRAVNAADLEGCEAVVHLAELSNDPLGQNTPAVTHQINHQGSVALARTALGLGIRRFVYTSSCSVYGAGSGEFLDETAPVTRRRPMRNARCWWSAILPAWPGCSSRQCACVTPPRSGLLHACASISFSTTCVPSLGPRVALP